MGMVKWTGEGFKLLGKILTNEIVEEVLEDFGKEITEKVKAGWFFGDRRRRWKMKKAMFVGVNSSKPLRMALNESLNKLPKIIRSLAHTISKKRIDILTKKTTFQKLIVVPRALVINDFTLTLLEDLADAAELKRFHGLPKHFLTKQAIQAEETFCDQFARMDNG